MLVQSFAIFLALVVLPVEGDEPLCCYPQKMEGARYTIERQRTSYFVADYERGYIFETEEIGGPDSIIYDLQTEKVYKIYGDKCRESPMREPALFSHCLYEEDVVQYNAIRGAEEQVISTDFFKYSFGNYHIFKETKWAEGTCYPVTIQTMLGRNRATLTTLYYNVHPEISSPDIFNHLETCNVEVRQETEEEAEEEHDEEGHGSDSDSEGD